MRCIWASRGRSWGFTFLATAGYEDPLMRYETAMAELDGASEGCVRVNDAVVLRFEDPEDRRDRSGRPIPHGFVLFDELAARVSTVDDGLREVWPLVSEYYAAVWDQPAVPRAIG